METKHTEGPWRVRMNQSKDKPSCEIESAVSSGDKNRESICYMSRGQMGEGDAKFIVRACNAHDDLHAACQDALECLDDILEDTEGDDGERIENPLLVQLRAALKKAEAAQ